MLCFSYQVWEFELVSHQVEVFFTACLFYFHWQICLCLPASLIGVSDFAQVLWQFKFSNLDTDNYLVYFSHPVTDCPALSAGNSCN